MQGKVHTIRTKYFTQYYQHLFQIINIYYINNISGASSASLIYFLWNTFSQEQHLIIVSDSFVVLQVQ